MLFPTEMCLLVIGNMIFPHVPYSETPEGPVFVRCPEEGEQHWVGTQPPRENWPAGGHSWQTSDDVLSSPPVRRNTFMPSQKWQEQSQSSAINTLLEPSTEDPLPRRTGYV